MLFRSGGAPRAFATPRAAAASRRRRHYAATPAAELPPPLILAFFADYSQAFAIRPLR